MNFDEFFLTRAFDLAKLGRFTTSPNPNVGCVIVLDNCIVGEGYHKCAGEPHAEVHALRMAQHKSQGATAYVTLEPCNHNGRTPPCSEALINAGIKRVVAAIPDPNNLVSGGGFYRLQQSGIEVCYGLMLAEAEKINKGFLKRIRTGLPWVRLKLASSIDGRIAMSSGESKWITSPEARQDVQLYRAESDAILSTAATVLIDDPDLTVRWQLLPTEVKVIYQQKYFHQPIRIIIDSTNCVKPTHNIIQREGNVWLLRLVSDNLVWPSSVEQIILPSNKEKNVMHFDLTTLMIKLGCKEINTLWVEAGASLAGALLEAGLVDEFILYLAPKLLGHNARPLCLLQDFGRLHKALSFRFISIKEIGPDICLSLKPEIIVN